MSRTRWFAPLTIAVFLGGWETAVTRKWASALFFPAPSTSLRALLRMASEGDLLSDLSATLTRAGLGLLIGGLAGVALGGAMAISRRLNEALDPLIAATHPIPKVTLLPLAVLAFGVGEAPRVALVAITTFYPMLIFTLTGVREIPRLYFDVARTFGAPRWQILRRILIPGSAPSLLAGARVAANLSFVITLSIELVFGERGIGRVIWFSWQTLRTDELFAALAVTALIGLSINSLLLAIARLALPWKTPSSTA